MAPTIADVLSNTHLNIYINYSLQPDRPKGERDDHTQTSININFSDLIGGRDKNSCLLHIGLEKFLKLWSHA